MDPDRDLPTTANGLAFLRRARLAAQGESVDYLAFLQTFGAPPELLRARPGPVAAEPFELS
ncbi:MAG: hypothetical protein ACYDA8_06355 [Deferrisomatales bacterium]